MSNPSAAEEVVFEYDFDVQFKHGIYLEAFSNPYLPELFQVSLAHTAADSIPVARSKSLWLELLPGTYTLQIVLCRQPEHQIQKRQVEFQLYVEYF